jgi:hypothetical protein
VIACPKCGHENSLTAVFCYGCGARVEVSYGQVMSSIAHTAGEQRDLAILGWGRSALSLTGFVLVCALILRYVAVPAAPVAGVPEAPPTAILAVDPGWAATLAPPPADAPVARVAVEREDRLAWRRRQGATLASAFSLDLAPLHAAQKALLALQKADRSFPGDEPMCATALAVLGLQAWPRSTEMTLAAAKGRAWIEGDWASITRRPALARSLAVAALADAEVLSDERRAPFGLLLVDGSAPAWQAFLLPLLPADRRIADTVALRNKLVGPVWDAYLALGSGRPVTIEPAPLFSEAAEALTTAEERLAWAQVAWLHPVAPDDFAKILRAWVSAPTAPTDAATAKACGPVTAPALALLIGTVPLRVPALSLSR